MRANHLMEMLRQIAWDLRPSRKRKKAAHSMLLNLDSLQALDVLPFTNWNHYLFGPDPKGVERELLKLPFFIDSIMPF